MPKSKSSGKRRKMRPARSPVERALLRQQLEQSTVDLKINILMLEQGEACAGVLAPVAAILQTVHMACFVDKLETAEVRVLKGSLSAALQQAQQNSFDKLQAVAIVAGLDRALDLVKVLRPGAIEAAWKEYARLNGGA